MKTIALAIIILTLSSCVQTERVIYHCPPLPHAGPLVASELAGLPLDGYEHTWDWLGRLEKYDRMCEALSK